MRSRIHLSLLVLGVVIFGLFCGSICLADAKTDKLTAKMIKDLGLRESAKPIKQMGMWKKPKVIVLTMMGQHRKSKPFAEEWLQKVAGKAKIIVVESRTVDPEVLKDADVLLGFCNHDNLKNGPKLRYILNYTAGVDQCIKSPLAKKRKILVTNSKRILGPGIAEHVIAMMYLHTRKLHVYHKSQLAKSWNRGAVKRSSMWEVQDRTMLVVGLGGIGSQVAKRAKALGMQVIAIRNSSRRGPAYVDKVGLPQDLLKFAGKADIVVNTAPLTPKTKHLFNAKFFSSMKRDAYFINVGRGKSVVTADLVAALNKEVIGGAALDVQDPEPLPPSSPLWTAKNVFITPHISAGSPRQMQRYWLLVRENLRRYSNGEKMLNVVNLQKGY